MSSTGQIVGTVVGGVVGSFTGVGFALGASIGGAIGGVIDPPKGPHSVGPRLNDRRVQVSSYGHELPRLYGTIKTAGCVIWLENDELAEHEVNESQGGKGGPTATSQTWTYSATFAVALATCPAQQVAGMRRMWIAGQLVYDSASGDTESMMASRSGVDFTFYRGSDDQLPDPRWQADKGVDAVSGLPGTVYIVIRDLDLTAKYSNSLMAAQVEVEIVAEPVAVTPEVDILAYTNTDNVFDIGHIRFETDAAEYSVFDFDGFWGDLNGVRFYRADFFQRHIETGHCAKVYDNNETFSRVPVRQCQTACALVQHKLTMVSTDSNLILYRKGATEPVEGPMMTPGEFPSSYDKEVAIDENSGEMFIFSRDGMAVYRFNGLTLMDSTASNYALSDLGYTTAYLYGVKYESSVVAGTVTIYKFDREDLSLVATWTGSANAYCLALHVADDDAIYTGNAATGEVLKWADGAIVEDLGAALPEDFSLSGSSYHVGWFSVFGDYPPYVMSHRRYDGASNGIYASLLPLPAGATGLRDIVTSECALARIQSSDLDLSGLVNHAVAGYAATGSARDALEPLQVAYQFDVFPSGYKIKFVSRGTASVLAIPEADLCQADGSSGVLMTDSREMSEQLPTATTVLYLDAAREYETGEQTIFQPGLTGVAERRVELPIVLTADHAAQTADRLNKLARAERNTLSFTLPCIGDYSRLDPADVVTVTHRGRDIECRLTRIEDMQDMRRSCTARPTSVAAYTSSVVGSSPLVNGQTLIPVRGLSEAIMLDIPRIVSDQDAFGIAAGVYGYATGWPGGVLVRSDDGGETWAGNIGFSAKSEVFTATTVLGTGRSDVVDHGSTLTVTPDWVGADLLDISWAQLMALGNLAAFGAPGRWEIIAFRYATASGDDYVLSGFLRGLFGSEHAMSVHEVGDRLVMLDINAIDYMGLPSSALNSPRLYRAVTKGASVSTADEQTVTCEGISLKPLSPCYPRGYRDPVTYDWHVSWYYRSRLPVDPFSGVDTPIGEASERYDAELWDSGFTTLIRRFPGLTSASFTYTFEEQMADGGLPLPETLYLKIVMTSATVGAGYPLQTNLYRYNYVVVDEYELEVMDLGPIGYYRLDESTGSSIADASDQNNTATASSLYITYSQTSLLTSGMGSCVAVANGGYITVPRLAAMDGAYSVSFLFNGATAASVRTIYHKGGSWADTSVAGHYLAINTDFRLSIARYNGGYATVNTTNVVFTANTTAHIVVTYDGSTSFKIYKNGSLFQAHTLTNAIPNNTQNLLIGARKSASGYENHMIGKLDEFVWFPFEMTSTQVSNLYAKA